MLSDYCIDADRFRGALEAEGAKPCIPSWNTRNEPLGHDNRRYRRRSRIEIMFGRFED